jgi:hypothetical protein
MATPAYTPYADANPIISRTRQQIVDDTRGNLLALRDAVIIGKEPGWTLSVSGGTAEEPSIRMWSQGTERLRCTITWTSGFPTSILWEWSNDSAATWSTIATETAAYDGSSNMTSGNSSSMLSWLYEWIGKFKALRTLYNAHVAATGTAVHGLGTISTQSAAAVAITGGTMKAVVVGSATPADCAIGTWKQAREIHAAATFGAPTTIDWSAGGSFDTTASGSGAVTLAFSNLPPSGVAANIVWDLTNGGLRTWTYPTGTKWSAGTAPTLTSSGRDLLSFFTRDGGTTIHGTVVSKDSR